MPWPFHRRRDTAADRAPAAVGAGAAARRDWAALPPLRPAVRPLAPTSAPQVFTSSLATRRPIVHRPLMTHVRGVASTSVARDAPALASVPSPTAPPPTIDPGAHTAPVRMPRDRARPRSGQHEGAQQHASAVDQLLSLPWQHETSVAAGDAVATTEARPADRRTVGPGAAATDPSRATPEPSPAPRTVAGDEPAGAGGGRRSLADSRRLGLGPAYHGPLPDAMRAEHGRANTAEPVPADVRAVVRDALGVDTGERLVHRGPEVTAEARALGAQAFVRDGAMYVGDDVGPLDSAAGRAIVAHELTHLAQQQLRASLPPEGSAEALLLEAQAQRVEQYVRGDAAAPKPPPALLHARPTVGDRDVIAESQQLMRDLIERGLARADGSGGVIFGAAAPAAAGAEVQRLVAPAPHAPGGTAQPEAPGRDSAAHSANWNQGDTWAHGLGSALANDMLTIGGSFLGLSDDIVTAERDQLRAEDRRFAHDQTRRAYHDMRMEHLQQRELRSLHDYQDAWHEPRSDRLSEATLARLGEQVTEEMNRRFQRLEEEKQRALAEINAARARQGQPAATHVAAESEDRAVQLLYGRPDTDELPSAQELHTALVAELAGADRARPASPPPGATTTPHATATPPGGTPPGGPAQPVAPPGLTPPAGAAHAPIAAAHGAARSGGHASPAGDAEPERGTHWRQIGEHGHEQRMWSGESTTSVGENFSSLGRTLVGDVLHQETEFLGSFFGFDEATQTEIDHGIDRDLNIAPSDRRAPGTDATAAGAPHQAHTAAAAGAAPHEAPHPDEASRQTVDRLARDPYALEELALRLYPNIRSRLRHELLVDRERAGLLTDFR